MGHLQSIEFPVLKLTQPIGEFFIGVIPAHQLVEVTFIDRREMQTETGSYLGIQRSLDKSRQKIISKYITTADATFPTSIVLAIDSRCVELVESTNTMILKAYTDTENPENSIAFNEIAMVLDGQHRIEGMAAANDLFRNNSPQKFDLNVTIFVDMELADQAMVFSTVNLHQSKVNNSLVYDLFELATTGSPQKTAHDIVVILNESPESPFFERIKRLGKSEEGFDNQTITQATFVQMLLKYISKDEIKDRSDMLRKIQLKRADQKEERVLIFRNLFIDGHDENIGKIVWSYFSAIADKWPSAWTKQADDKGFILHKTNGFRAFMRYLREAYLNIIDANGMSVGDLVTKTQFKATLNDIILKDDDFNTLEFNPGSGGESRLYKIISGKEKFESFLTLEQ